MTIRTYKLMGLTLALAAGAAALFVSDNASVTTDGFKMSSAEARIGRPLTPVSYAGVARRTTRRAVATGVAVGAAAAAPVVVVAPRPGCVQVVNSYGQIYWQCP